MGVHKKDAPRKLETRREAADPVRAVMPLARPRAGTAGVAATVVTGVLAAGALMAALAPGALEAAPFANAERGSRLRSDVEARSAGVDSRALTASPEPAPLLANADGFPPTPVPTTVRLVPNPRPPRMVAGGMRATTHTVTTPTIRDPL